MRFLIIFIFFISTAYGNETLKIKNIVVNKEPKTYDNITFLDSKEKIIELNDYNGYLVMLNFWATWCAPCKEEMPSLDDLQLDDKLSNLKIFPINIGQEDISKSEFFFKELNIKNLNIYFDAPITLAKKFSLRGVPTTILFNKQGKEFARIIGSIDFQNEKFINWLKLYN